jgi:oligosaccharide repeat unit polymerase
VKSYKNKTQKYKEEKNLFLIPLIIVIAIIPLIVRVHFFNTNLSQYPWASRIESSVDLFLYYKSVFLILTSFVMLLILIFRKVHSKKVLLMFIPLGIYLLLALISSVFSKYSYFSFNGMLDHFETIWVILGYGIITYYAAVTIKSEDDVKKILKWLMISLSIIAVIGIGQAFSLDIFRSTLGKVLISPSSMWSNLDAFQYRIEKGRVYSTLFNPNYIGSYVTLVAPIVLVLFLFAKEKKDKTIFILIFVGLMVCLFASQSRTGIIALFFSMIIMTILLRKYIIHHFKLLLIVIIGGIFMFFMVNIANHNMTLYKIKDIFKLITVEKPLEEIQTNNDNVTIKYNNESLILRYNMNNSNNEYTFDIEDRVGNKLNYYLNDENTGFYIDDSRFQNFVIGPAVLNEKQGFFVQIDGIEWFFTNLTDGTYYYYTRTLGLDKINNAKTIGFDYFGKYGSGRGYIWSRTIPLIKKYIFVGSGADTFALVFPNDDYVGLTNYGFTDGIMTKPHNMYLQIAVQSGLLSLVAFLIFYLMYFIMSIKILYKNKMDTFISQIGSGILGGTTGYIFAGLANDSTIAVAPVFWSLIGIGFAINLIQLKFDPN